MDNKEAYIDEDWLTVENYQFKILVMVAALAENHLAYRGKLKDMCEFLGVGNSTSNTDKIKKALAALEKSGDIKTIKDGHTWTITLSVKAERKSKIIKIRNAWIKVIQQYKCKEGESVSWENILKVLVYLCADKTEVKRYDMIGKALNISSDAAKRAVHALDNIDFGDIAVKRKIAWLKTGEDYKVIGQKLEVGYTFGE
jgi:hypothetical protein